MHDNAGLEMVLIAMRQSLVPLRCIPLSPSLRDLGIPLSLFAIAPHLSEAADQNVVRTRG